MSKSLSIVIPAYNEAESLPVYLPKVLAHCEAKGYQLIIVNDGSRDNSKELLNGFNSSALTVIHHKVNKGYGGAIKSGIKAATTDFCVTIDADGQHNLEDVDAVLKVALDTDADMVVGSREGQKSASLYRGVGKAVIRGIAKMLMPLDVHDINSGMKLYDTQLAQKYIKLTPDNMAFSDTILMVFVSQRHLVKEHPISINERIGGVSTISTRTAFETIIQIINIVVLFNPYRIFLPISFFGITFGIVWAIISLIRVGDGISVGAMLAFVTGVIFFFLGLIAEQLSLIRKNSV